VAEYDEPTCPEASDVVVIETDAAAGAMVIENDLVAFCGVALES
jgi:hypothetical protein